ncbi:O-antigen ligase family protein [Dyadobacter koreensis]|uniref:O-antigen ligase family protein n=1 Tax=Dyadobacter koreensis TaxID=408657 RepID=UPI00116015DC|nr:hypothetical protein [Dyadobacter koreensis]
MDKKHDPNKYFKSFSLVLVTYIVYTVAANVFKLGTMYSSKQDSDDSFQTGNIIGDFLLQFSFSVLLIPLIFFYNNDKKYRIFYILCSCITIPLLLVSTRRTSVLIIVAGYIIFLFFYKNKSTAILYSLLFSFAASLFVLNFSDTIVKRFEARADRLEVNSFEAEGRTLEYFVVSDLIFSFKDPLHSLFGKDIYAERGVLKTFYSERHLHTDYGKLLHGTGIIGFLLYILFIYTLVIISFRQRRYKINGDEYALHFSTIIMLIGCKVILSYTGGFHVISYNAMVFGTIGLILAIQKRSHQENLIQNSIIRNQTAQQNETRLHS